MESNWDRIKMNVIKYLGKDIEVKPSTRKNKKVMVLNPLTNKWIHFGEKGYIDYTASQDIDKLILFRKRNAKWKNAEKWTPAYLSWWILWA
jgi:hypothetical protein